MKHKLIIITLFCCLMPTILAQNKVKQMEYWVNDDIANKKVIEVAKVAKLNLNTTIKIDGMKTGLNKLSLRFIDDNNKYSPIIIHMVEAFSAGQNIKGYEYWYDNDYASKVTTQVSLAYPFQLQNININDWPEGMHFFNIRFVDQSGKWSAVQHHNIFKSRNATSLSNAIREYRYWLDENIEENTTKSIKNNAKDFSLTISPDLSGGNIFGKHTLNLQFRDTFGLWSEVVSSSVIIRKGSSNVLNVINGYRYWLNNDFNNVRYTQIKSNTAINNLVENIDLTMFEPGSNHYLRIQFQDASGLWSAVQNTYFQNSGGGTLLFNAVTGYRYWFDGNIKTSIFAEMNPALASVSINESLDLNQFIGENRKMYFQFKDASGLWSMPTTDTVTVKNSVGFKITEESSFMIYPNPNNGVFRILTEPDCNNAEVCISNMLGELIFREKLITLKDASVRLMNPQPGIYFVQLVDVDAGKILNTSKLIIKN